VADDFDVGGELSGMLLLSVGGELSRALDDRALYPKVPLIRCLSSSPVVSSITIRTVRHNASSLLAVYT